MSAKVRFIAKEIMKRAFSELFGFRNYRYGIEDMYTFSDINTKF